MEAGFTSSAGSRFAYRPDTWLKTTFDYWRDEQPVARADSNRRERATLLDSGSYLASTAWAFHQLVVPASVATASVAAPAMSTRPASAISTSATKAVFAYAGPDDFKPEGPQQLRDLQLFRGIEVRLEKHAEPMSVVAREGDPVWALRAHVLQQIGAER
jgi:hypothetical protein